MGRLLKTSSGAWLVTIAKKCKGMKLRSKARAPLWVLGTLGLPGKDDPALGAFDVQPGPLRAQAERKTGPQAAQMEQRGSWTYKKDVIQPTCFGLKSISNQVSLREDV